MMSEEKPKVPKIWRRIRWFFGLLFVAMVAYVAWNADWTNYEELKELRDNEEGHTGKLEWYIRSSFDSAYWEEFLDGDMLTKTIFEPVRWLIADGISIYERITGHSRTWYELVVEFKGEESEKLNHEDIYDLPLRRIGEFDARGSIIDANAANSLSKLLSCHALQIDHIDGNGGTVGYLSEIPLFETMILSPNVFPEFAGTLQRFTSLTRIEVLGNSQEITADMLKPMQTESRLREIRMYRCSFRKGAVSAINDIKGLEYITLSDCKDDDYFKDLRFNNLSHLSCLRIVGRICQRRMH